MESEVGTAEATVCERVCNGDSDGMRGEEGVWEVCVVVKGRSSGCDAAAGFKQALSECEMPHGFLTDE